ncbi:hypothetical protein ONS95_008198 [Cadophora gregata]|uniref:uncharacterized protein n=1 Tax=Cadophora gregata TaxID=51156 RepID=UPI0026DC9E68|nr:uncharacterized protein ONS95_008198 [Cadophora gregata]KAK0100234.1 hypothetical protein ONS96_007517 [Cadophora gregata f. sp. sojae]KAK0126610.1 hypothetical protein ONS95_008198 [Cadophora gregata]
MIIQLRYCTCNALDLFCDWINEPVRPNQPPGKELDVFTEALWNAQTMLVHRPEVYAKDEHLHAAAKKSEYLRNMRLALVLWYFCDDVQAPHVQNAALFLIGKLVHIYDLTPWHEVVKGIIWTQDNGLTRYMIAVWAWEVQRGRDSEHGWKSSLSVDLVQRITAQVSSWETDGIVLTEQPNPTLPEFLADVTILD